MNQKTVVKYIFLFVFFFFAQVFLFNVQRGDSYVNFGFSYALSRGEIPYLDFNMVIPPFAPWLYSLFLVFKPSILCFYAGQALLLTILFYFLFRQLSQKAWIFFLVLSIPYPVAMTSILFPGYNFLLLFLLVLILYCEKENKSDYLIGVLLGLSFLTKQTVGGILFLVSIYYLFVDYKKFFKRILGFIIPVGFCVFLFFLQGNLFQFLDLCFLGLFDFGYNNLSIDWFYFTLLVISLLILVIRIIRCYKDISNYYVLLFASCVYPIVDFYHVSLFLAAFILLLLYDLKIKQNISIYCIILSLFFGVAWLVVEKLYFTDLKIVHYPNFEFSMVSEQYASTVEKLERYLNTLDGDIIYLLRGNENYFFKIKNNLDITYFDLPNYGNYGYQGISNIISRLKEIKCGYIVIDLDAYISKDNSQQYIKEAVDYVMQRGKKVQTIGVYEVYQFQCE